MAAFVEVAELAEDLLLEEGALIKNVEKGLVQKTNMWKAAEEGLLKTESELVAIETNESRALVKRMADTLSGIKKRAGNIFDKKNIKPVLKFVGKNMAMAAVFEGTIHGIKWLIQAVKALLAKKEDPVQRTKLNNLERLLAVMEAIQRLFLAEIEIYDNLTPWLEKHKHVKIKIDLFSLTLESVLVDSVEPLTEDIEDVIAIGEKLKPTVDGSTDWKIPTAEDIKTVLNASSKCIQAYEDFMKNVDSIKDRPHELQQMPLTQNDISNLKKLYDDASKLPLY